MQMKRLLMSSLLIIATGAGAKSLQEVPVSVAEVSAEDIETSKMKSLNDLWHNTPTGTGIQQALVQGVPSAEVLVGYEYSDVDGGDKAAQAVISRIRLNYETGRYEGFGAFVQAQYVGPINDHYAPENDNYDTVADPEAFRFHQAYLSYVGYDSTAKFGAQEIILDNARFIGNVGWRLNAQSFNAASVANHSISNLALTYAYIDSINAIDGEINHDRQYHLLNAEYELDENNQAAAFAYLQRNDNGGEDKLDTYGLRLWGQNDNLSHEFILALQRDAYYGSVLGEIKMDALKLGAGIEYISGGNEDDEQFQTLNGTAHKFNGWADQFAGATGGGTEGGLIDIYGQASGKVCDNVKLMGVYHWFNTADETDGGFEGEYGQEIDLLAKYSVCENFDVLAKAAYYIKGENDGDNLTNDETVFWLRGTLRF